MIAKNDDFLKKIYWIFIAEIHLNRKGLIKYQISLVFLVKNSIKNLSLFRIPIEYS